MASPTTSGFTESVDDGSIGALLQKYESIKVYDAHKAAYFDELVQRLRFVSGRLTEERAEFDQQRKWMQQKLMSLGQDGDVSNGFREADPFVLVLIDGNDLVFRNNYLREGDLGGRLAARALFQAVNEHVFSSIDNLPDNIKVVARVYIDLEDLCSVCLRTGIVSNANKIKTFVRGFCQDKALFDLIDVGMQGRPVIYDKMEEILKLHVFDKYCKHIVFGCADGEVYARVLRPFASSFDTKHRITLLCGAQADKDLASLQLETIQMTSIFRNTGMDTHRLVDYVSEINPLPAHLMEVVTPPSSTPATSRSNSRTAKEPKTLTEMGHSRQVSISSSVQSSEVQALQVKPKMNSWAMAAQKGAAVKAAPASVPETPLKEPLTPMIRRNKKGQRIDPPTPEFKKNEVERLKKLKLCNAHHLRGDCPYPDSKCTHDHMYKPNKQEVETLKLVARMSACIHGSECDDPKCIYGHRCPFPEAREGSMRGRGCINGENCRFPAHMHAMDMAPVRVTKIS